jgi:Reverse transcriptase (RNA-dependent DNA polymerase)
MFKLSDQELENSFEAINHHGYSAMLPEPVEWKHVQEKWQEVKNHIKDLDLDEYKPYKLMKIFAPKSRANIRIVHLLYPQDLIIYTALVLIIKNDIESNRISRQSQRVFSYRVDLSRANRLYDTKGTHDLYLDQLKKKVYRPNTKFIGIADIADFYPRIYQHRLENIIQTVAINPRGIEIARVLVKKLISNLMETNSYGIPVGPYASRILAEAVLIDVDSYLHSHKIDFVRWVDDYNIFCKSERDAQSNLFRLGEWLYSKHGLTLQSAKTKILPTNRYIKEILVKPDENLRDRDYAVSFLKRTYNLYQDEVTLEEEEIQDVLEKIQSLDLYNMLQESISDSALVDYEIVNYILTRLPRIPGIPDALKHRVLDLIIEKSELLYPLSEQIAKYIVSFTDISMVNKKKIAKKLLSPLINNRNPPPTYYVMWILYIFSTSEDWNQVKDIIMIYQNYNSEVVRRYAALAIAKGGTRNEALVIKDDFSGASDMLRLAILEASKKLGKDERKHWKLTHQIHGIIEKIII